MDGQFPGLEVIKTFFMLSPSEHEILNSFKYKNIKKYTIFQAQFSPECYVSCSLLLFNIYKQEKFHPQLS